MGRVAAIDFGTKRIGIALSDQNQKIALPLTVVEGGKKALQQIKNALPLKEIELILIGLPLEMDGKKGEMAQKVEEFAKMIEEGLNLPILLVDERLSSKGAEVQMKEISLNRKSRNEKIDMMAAALLLQTYLDHKTYAHTKPTP